MQTHNRDASHCPRTPVDLRGMYDVATYFRAREKKALLRFSPLFTPGELSTLALCLQDSSSVPLQHSTLLSACLSHGPARSGFLALSSASCFVSHPRHSRGEKVVQDVKSPPRHRRFVRPLLCKPSHPLVDKIMQSATVACWLPYVTRDTVSSLYFSSLSFSLYFPFCSSSLCFPIPRCTL